MKSLLAVGVAMVGAVCAFAESGTFTNTAASVAAKVFIAAEQWTNENGVAVSEVPMGNTTKVDAQTAILPDVPGGQDVMITKDWTATCFGTLIGSSTLRTISMAGQGRMLYIANPNDFKGIFCGTTRYTGYESSSSETFTPVFGTIENRYCIKASNMNKKGLMKIGESYGFGVIEFNGRGNHIANAPGVVEVGKAGPWQSAFVWEGNNVTGWDKVGGYAKGGGAWRGQPAAAEAKVPGDPWMHLDAEDADTVETDANGRVTLWRDVRGDGHPYADPITVKAGTALPAQPTVKVRGEKRYVDFGASSGRCLEGASGNELKPSAAEVALYGAPAALKWSEQRTDITDVFFVFEDTQPSNSIGALIGRSGTASDAPDFTRGDMGKLFYAPGIGVRTGRVAVDGVRVVYDWADDYAYRPHLVSVNASAPLCGGTFAADNRSVSGTLRSLGGTRFGEVLVYTNKLTDAEIAQVERYLLEKWIPKKYHPRNDLEALAHSAPGNVKTSVTVNGEGEFRVRDLRFGATQAEIVKEGDGDMVADNVTPRNLPITVKGGAFRFRRMTDPIDDTKPADDPYLWLDATDRDSMTVETVDLGGGVTTNYVTRWNDVRPGQKRYYMTPLTSGKKPALIADAQNGKPVIDFGPQVAQASKYAAFMLNGVTRTGGSGNIEHPYLEGFIVFRRNDPAYYSLPIHASAHSLQKYDSQNVYERWGNRSGCGDAIIGAQHRFNGAPANLADAEQAPSGNPDIFGVYSIAAPARKNDCVIEALRLCGFNGDAFGGGGQVAEVIYYKRRLTPSERRDTEAYLMKKWGLGEHPEAAKWTSVPKMSFAAGVNPVIETDDDLVIGAFEAPNASSLEKGGAGKIELTDVPTSVSAFEVNGGSLSAELTLGKGYDAPVAIHLDAEDSSQFRFAGEGYDEGAISRWYNAAGGKVSAMLGYEPDGGVGTYPVRREADASEGLLAGLHYVDFLEYHSKDDAVVGKSARMWWTYLQDDATYSGSKVWNQKMGEVHFVFAKSGATMPFGDCQNSSTEGHVVAKFTSSGNKMFDTMGSGGVGYKNATNVHCLVDNDYVWHNNAYSSSSSYDPGTGFHVVSLVLANTNVFHFSNLASTWTGGSYGGMKLAEVIGFEGTNSTLVAQAIHSALLKKWRGIGDGQPKGKLGLSSVKVAAGASFTMQTAVDAAVASLSGGGTFKSEGSVSLDEGGTVGVTYLGPRQFSETKVQTTLSCPVSATVRVAALPAGVKRTQLYGSHRILSATAFANLDNARGWTLDASAFAGIDVEPRLSVRSDGVYLDIPSPGMMLIVR